MFWECWENAGAVRTTVQVSYSSNLDQETERGKRSSMSIWHVEINIVWHLHDYIVDSDGLGILRTMFNIQALSTVNLHAGIMGLPT